jgi:hypothetical protein
MHKGPNNLKILVRELKGAIEMSAPAATPRRGRSVPYLHAGRGACPAGRAAGPADHTAAGAAGTGRRAGPAITGSPTDGESVGCPHRWWCGGRGVQVGGGAAWPGREREGVRERCPVALICRPATGLSQSGYRPAHTLRSPCDHAACRLSTARNHASVPECARFFRPCFLRGNRCFAMFTASR